MYGIPTYRYTLHRLFISIPLEANKLAISLCSKVKAIALNSGLSIKLTTRAAEEQGVKITHLATVLYL